LSPDCTANVIAFTDESLLSIVMILPTALFEYGNVSVIAPLVASHLNIAGASYVVVLAVI
jgi:hypothetical protein